MYTYELYERVIPRAPGSAWSALSARRDGGIRLQLVAGVLVHLHVRLFWFIYIYEYIPETLVPLPPGRHGEKFAARDARESFPKENYVLRLDFKLSFRACVAGNFLN